MSVKAWCQQEGITPTTYYRWQREIRRDFLASAEGQEMAAQLLPVAAQPTKMLPGPRFSEVPALSLETPAVSCAEPAIRVQIGEAVIEIQKETDARLAESVVRAFAKLC
jgi:transposase-like protein